MKKPAPDIHPARLSKYEIEKNFADLHAPLSRSEALIEADRCYFCFDAPCTTACPTAIDIPAFIQKIRSDNLRGSAHTILAENIMGGMCARVCPTEVLCEQACVRNTHEDKPVAIGLLQRYATDAEFSIAYKSTPPLFTRGEPSGRTVAIAGGGPAGLACAHRLAMLGHEVVVFNRDLKPGGLNEYGIAAYKTVNDFAQAEVDYILSIGGIEVRGGLALGEDITLDELQRDFDAVFIAIGLGSVNELGIDNEGLPGVISAIDYIAELRQTKDMSTLPVGNNVVVIGGGMTAIDIAVQSKRLGAQSVTIAYRRGPEQMGASRFEQELALTSGVTILHWVQPTQLVGKHYVEAVKLERTTADASGKLTGTGQVQQLDADVVFKAIGQALDPTSLVPGLTIKAGKLQVDADYRTSVDGIWAGGDCVLGGDDLTVSAVQHGKLAAISIDRYLRRSK